MSILLVFVSVTVAALAVFVARRAFQLDGVRVVTCPETREPVAVDIDLQRASVTSLVGAPSFRLQHCTRWPEKQNCGQECLSQIEDAPEACLVRNMLGHWYLGQHCAFCGQRFVDISWHDHKPGLRGPDGLLHEWADLPPESVPVALAADEPVCWNCMIVEGFRRDHPELIVERPRAH